MKKPYLVFISAIITFFWVSLLPKYNAIAQTVISPEVNGYPEIYIRKAKDEEKPALQEWINETIRVLESENFTKNLFKLEAIYDQVWYSEVHQTNTIRHLGFTLSVSDPSQLDASYLKTGIILKGKSRKKPSSSIGYIGNTFASVGPNSRKKTLPPKMRIGRVHLDRFVTGNALEKSCAINTLAHEISHTLSSSSTNLQSYFLDIPEGKEPEGVPVASYLVGTIAQCTYLEEKGRIESNQFTECVKLFVPQPFPSKLCDDYPDGVKINW